MNPPLSKTFYRGIDTWRGLAALLVCIYHFTWYEGGYGPLFPHDSPVRRYGEYGSMGVYLFFVISGFVIPLSMHAGGYTYRKAGRFLAKRSLRIEPPYLAAILVSLLVEYAHCRLLWALPFTFEPRRFLAHVVYAVPFIKGMQWYNIVFWTLAIEFQFYLACACLYPLFTHTGRWLRHGSLLAFLLSARLLADERVVSYYAPMFGLGILLFLFRKGYINRLEAGLYVILCATLLYTGCRTEVFVACMLALGLLALPDFAFAPGTYLGKISYSLYLIHGCTGSVFLYNVYRGHGNPYLWLAAALGVSLVCAAVFYLVVEKQAQTLSRKIKL